MTNSCFLSRAQLSALLAIVASAAALALQLAGFTLVAMGCQVAAIVAAGLAVLWIWRTARLVAQAGEVCRKIALGDFEARIMAAPTVGGIGALLHAINGMIDGCAAFVREATAAMTAVHHSNYCR